MTARYRALRCRALRRGLVFTLLATVCACNTNRSERVSDKNPANDSARSATEPAATREAEQIMERHRTLDTSRDSTMKMRAQIEASEQEDPNTPRQVRMTIYRKRASDGTQLMLIEFNAPAEQRDRSALVTINPKGEVEATRYTQSSDSFVTTKDVMSEDALFGMSLQELAEGQPEKYEFKLIGEESFQSSPAYRLEGKLKQGAESKFPRLVMLISKESFAALVAEFYDNRNGLVRRMVVDKVEQINGHWTRKHWTVENRTRKRKITFETSDVKYDQNLNDSIFTREHLKKIASR